MWKAYLDLSHVMKLPQWSGEKDARLLFSQYIYYHPCLSDGKIPYGPNENLKRFHFSILWESGMPLNSSYDFYSGPRPYINVCVLE